MAIHNVFGQLGEELAKEYLIKNNYHIAATNWRYLKAEIDIICQKDKTLHIVEVKTRTTTYFGSPESFVSNQKRKLLIIAANAYVEQNNLDVEVQFDIIAITKNKTTENINHIENAFCAIDVI